MGELILIDYFSEVGGVGLHPLVSKSDGMESCRLFSKLVGGVHNEFIPGFIVTKITRNICHVFFDKSWCQVDRSLGYDERGVRKK